MCLPFEPRASIRWRRYATNEANMNPLRAIRLWLRAFLNQRELDSEMEQEMRSHVEMQTQENIEAGMTPKQAYYAALRQFGWAESIKEDCREQWSVRVLDNLVRDLKSALRQLLKHKGS